MQFKQLYDGLMSSSVRDLSLAASDAKKGMFDHLILKRDLDKRKIRAFLGGVNDFLTFWCGYANDLVEIMKTTKGKAGIYCLPYEDVKGYIYTKYDLPSVLKFADALIEGINKQEFTKTDDIKNLFVEHVNKAFPDRADDVGGLLSEVLQSEARPSPRTIDVKEAKLFDTAKKYKWFSTTDHSTIYKAIETTCTYMTEKYGLEKHLSTKDLKLYVNVINMTVEYMMYTLVAYATRIYMISLYTWPHYTAVTYSAPRPVCESAKWDETINTMQETDGMLTRDPRQLDKLGEKIYEFLKMIGAKHEEVSANRSRKFYTYLSDDKIKDNVFFKSSYDNELFSFLRTPSYDLSSQGRISETKHRLELTCLSSQHGISSESTPKQSILHIIRGTKPDGETLEGYRKLASDLASFGLNLLYMIATNIQEYERWIIDTREDLWEGQSTKNNADACKKISLDLYREIAAAVVQKCRDIEMRYNELSGTTLDQINKQLEVRIPGAKSDRSLDDNMAIAVPSSTRVPIDVIQVYASPVFDESAMYLEWLGTKPELRDYWYIQEASGNPVDNLMALFKSIWNRILSFFNSKSFKKAREWVERNQESLRNMSFEGIELKNLPAYKDRIVVSDHYNNLIKGLGSFNPAEMDSQEKVEKFIASLYPNETVASWFPMNGQNLQAGKQRWRNYFLFQDLENASDQPVKNVTLSTDTDIRRRMAFAIRDILQSESWLKNLEQLNNRIGGGMDHLKQSSVRIKMIKESSSDGLFNKAVEQAAQNGSSSTPSTPATPAGGSTTAPKQGEDGGTPKAVDKNETQNASQQNTQQQQQTQNGVNSQLMKSVFTGTQAVLNNIWFSATSMIVEYINTQYKTITSLYDIATEHQNNAAQQVQGNQQQEAQGQAGGTEQPAQ